MDSEIVKRDKDVDVIINAINHVLKVKSGELPAAMTLDDNVLPCKVTDWISTQSPMIDKVVIQRDGIPLGRLTEVYGPEASGKTTLTAHMLAECQQQGGIAALIDTEQAYDPEYAAKIGVDNSKLIVMQADVLEDAYTMMETLIETVKKRNKDAGNERKTMIVLDSAGGTPARAELEGEAGDSHMGVAARIHALNLRRIIQTIAKERIGLVFTNQEYSKMGRFGGKTSKGGDAIKYHASVRLRLHQVGVVEGSGDNKDAVGVIIECYGAKNKVGKPFRKRTFPIILGEGIDVKRSYFDVALEAGLISQSGSWYTYHRTNSDGEIVKEIKFQGASGFREALTGKVYVGLKNDVKRI